MRNFAPVLPVALCLLAAAMPLHALAGTLTLASSGSNVPSAGGLIKVSEGEVILGSSTYTGGTTVAGHLADTTTGLVIKSPALSGTASDLQFTALNNGSTLRVKTVLSISNTGTKAAKNVTATVYVSDDAALDTGDLKVKTLKLSDYVPTATKLHKGETLSLPVKYKVPTAIASFLEGKYLIAVLNYAPANTLSFSGVVAGSSGTPNVFIDDANGTVELVHLTGLPTATPTNYVIIGPIHLPTGK